MAPPSVYCGTAVLRGDTVRRCAICLPSIEVEIDGLTPCACHDAGSGFYYVASWGLDPNGTHLVDLDNELDGVCYYPEVGTGTIAGLSVQNYTDPACTNPTFSSNPSFGLNVRINKVSGKIEYASLVTGGTGFIFLWTGEADFGDVLNNSITSCPAGTGTAKAYGGTMVINRP